eukprot:8536003-Pyramimonas_sp.AAC.1
MNQISICEFFASLSPASHASGLPGDAWRIATAAAREEIRHAGEEARRPRPQRVLARSLSSSLFPDSLPSLLSRRLQSWFEGQ